VLDRPLVQGPRPALLDAMVRRSDDGGRSWTEARNITPGGAYWCMTNDRLVRLASGRVLYPMSENSLGCHMWLSDDDGLSWRQGSGAARPADGVSYEEPTVVELAGGRVGMFIRTNTGNIHMARSADGGDTWTPWKVHPPDMCGHADSGPNAARSPCMVKRIPSAGDLLLVWNNNRVRTPLASAVSCDEGHSWQHVRTVEPMDGWPPRLTHAYPSLAFQGDWVHMTYWETHAHPTAERLIHLRYRRLPVTWFYKT
jgi:sialidase-1